MTDSTQTSGRPSSRREFWITLAAFLALAIVASAALAWRQLQIRYHSYMLTRFGSQGGSDSIAAEPHFQTLFRLGAVRQGMSYDQVVAVLGEPCRDKQDLQRGERRCEWYAQSLPEGARFVWYVVIFGPDGKADLVPHMQDGRLQRGPL